MKRLSPEALKLLWLTFPEAAKRELSIAHLGYAMAQRLADPDPEDDRALTIQLLSYLYPRRDKQPLVSAGLRSDLQRRMADMTRFHPLVVDASQLPPELPALPPAEQPAQTLEEIRARFERIAAQTGVTFQWPEGL